MRKSMGIVSAILLLSGVFAFVKAQQSPIIPQPLSFPFGNYVEWKITSGGGYNNGNYHGGSEPYALYALDFEREAGNSEGELVYAPTNAFYVRQEGTSPDCIDLAIGDYDVNNWIWLQICHIDLESYIPNGQLQIWVVEKGQVLGRISSVICGPAGRCPVPHVHMAAFIGEKYYPIGPNKSYVPLHFGITTVDLRLDSFDFYSTREDRWNGQSGLLSSNPVAGQCSPPPELNNPVAPVSFVSSMTIYPNVCGYTEQDVVPISTATPTPTGGGSQGDSDIDLLEHANYQGTQYGGDSPSGLIQMPDYMDNRASSLRVEVGQSVMLYDNANGTGSQRCFNSALDDFQDVYFSDGTNANDRVSSFRAYANVHCDGQYGWGIEPGDTATVHDGADYNGGKWGVRQTGSFNLPFGGISSIAMFNGWSVLVHSEANNAGHSACYWWSDENMSDDYYPGGSTINDNVVSIEVFHDSNCGNWTGPTATPTQDTPYFDSGLVANGSFELLTNGWADGWSNNSFSNITIDTLSVGNHGYKSLRFASASQNTSAVSAGFSVNYTHSYQWSMFVSISSGTGEFGYYIDEYDANWNWVSGQWLGAEHDAFQGTRVFSYVPTSSNVSYAAVQYYALANTSLVVYIDSVSVFDLGTNATATPTPINLIANGTFELGLSDWSTDALSVYVDAGMLHFAPDTVNTHAFASGVSVSYGFNYVWATYVSVLSGTGEFGYYIDEYDANWNWVSGQWLGAEYGQYQNYRVFSYSPTSSSVAFAALQYYLAGGSTFDVYADNVSLTQD